MFEGAGHAGALAVSGDDVRIAELAGRFVGPKVYSIFFATARASSRFAGHVEKRFGKGSG
jgi:hypothetical protein